MNLNHKDYLSHQDAAMKYDDVSSENKMTFR